MDCQGLGPAALVLIPILSAAGCGQGQLCIRLEPGPLFAQAAQPRGEAAGPRVPAAAPELPAPREQPPAPASGSGGPVAWGIAGLRGFAFSQQVAPNGQEYKPLFAADLNFNLWLWRSEGVYFFGDSAFWGQRAAPGVTNTSQGAFDFSKREFDLSVGLAWNYWGPLEARAFAYSYNNLNRGTSATQPSGYADGFAVENRWYVSPTYADLGTAEFDVARAAFLSAGYYPAKELVDANGRPFTPGPFVRAYLVVDPLGPLCYLYADAQAVARRTFTPELLKGDFGVAARPFPALPELEFRLGSNNVYDPRGGELQTGLYGQVRYLY